MEEDRPHFLNRIAEYSDSEKQLAIRFFEETLQKMKQEVDDLVAEKTALP